MTDFPFDVVLFDLDGTLADTAPDLAAALNHALGALGRPPVPPESVRHMVGQGVRALLRKGLDATGGHDEALIEQGLPLYIAYYQAHIADGSRPFPGIEAAMDDLAARGVRLAVCTNKLQHLAERFIAAIGWTDRFATIVGGDTAGAAKPDPAPVHLAIERSGGGRAAFVGDSSSDTLAAAAAGIPCVVYPHGFHDRPPAELGGTVLIDHFDALVPALERLG